MGGTDGGGTGSQNSLRRAGGPRSAAGRSVSASPAAPVARAPPTCEPGPVPARARRSAKQAGGSSYIRSTIVGVSDARPSASRDSARSTFVSTSQHTGPPAAIDPRRSYPSCGCAARADEPRLVLGAPAPHGVELRRGIEARLVGLHDPDQPVAVEVAVLAQPVVVADDCRHAAGSPTAIRHAHASDGGWMLDVIGASARARCR